MSGPAGSRGRAPGSRPGVAIVTRSPRPTSATAQAVLGIADLTVGASARATRLGLAVGAVGWGAGATGARVAARLPGVAGLGRVLARTAEPLIDDGRRVRRLTGSALGERTMRLIEEIVPEVIDAIDVERVLARIDIDALVSRIDIDGLVGRIAIDDVVQRIDIDRLVANIDIDALVRRIAIDDVVKRIDIDELVSSIDIDSLVARIEIDNVVKRIDIDELVSKIDIDRLVRRIEIDDLVGRIDIDDVVKRIAIDEVVSKIDIDAVVRQIAIDEVVKRIDIDDVVHRVDVNDVVQRVDVDELVEQTELGTIVAQSTSGFATEALDAARSQTAGLDTLLSRAVNRALRRREGDVPIGPPGLVGEGAAESGAPELGTDDQPHDAGGAEQ